MEKKTILMVDDEEHLCQLVKMNLESLQRFKVIYATDPREGLRLARLHRPDLILMDLLMPYMEGSEVADQLMQSPDTDKIPIVFLTALADKNQVRSSMGTIAGRQFIAKPVTTGELVRRIDEILRTSR